jgi:Peptidase family S41
MRTSQRVIFFFCFLLLCAFSKDKREARKHPFDPKRIFTIEELQEDFRVLRKDIEKRQPNLYVYSTKERMDFVFDSLYTGINHPMDFYEFFQYVAVIQSFIKDGHNLISPSISSGFYHQKQSLYLPIHLQYLDGKLYADMNCAVDTILYDGAQIIRINDEPADKIKEEILMRMPRDGENETLPYSIMNRFFRGLYCLRSRFPAQHKIDFINRKGMVETIAINSLSYDSIVHVWNRKYKTRLDAEKKMNGLQLHFDSASGAAVMRIETFDQEFLKKRYHQHFIPVVRNFFQRIDSAKSKTLVLDLRDNGGGNPKYSLFLMKQLMNEPFIYAEQTLQTRRFNPGDRWSRLTNCKVWGFGKGTFKPDSKHFTGRIIVLMNGGSFSATGEVTSILSRYKRAEFVGEETGGNAVICGGQIFKHHVVLPHSRLICYTGTEASLCRNIKENTGHGTMPDYFVKNSIQDILSNRDAEMEYALNLAR